MGKARDFTVSDKKLFLDKLVKIRDCGPRETHNGICNNLGYSNRASYDGYDVVAIISLKWDKFSGKRWYPVEFIAGDKWDKTCQYGKLRYELLDFLIQELSMPLSKLIKKYPEFVTGILED